MRITGVIHVHPKGFGFLNFEHDGEARSAFVIPPDLNPFLADDLVSAEIKEGEDGRFSAHNLKLEKRVRLRLFGRVIRRRKRLWIQTDPEVANTHWPLEGKCEEDSWVSASLDGQRAVFERVSSDNQALERLLDKYQLVADFPKAAAAQVRDVLGQPHDLGKRKDLRQVPTVTIDAPSTTDLDDAVSILPADSEGAIRLLVSIADPASFIPTDSPLDDEARHRGTSAYLTDRVIPMLPHELSSDHLSLVPREDRSCMTAELRIDPQGEVLSVDVYQSLICSDTRLTYDELADWLDLGEMTPALEIVEEILPWMRTAAARLNIARQRRGGVRVSNRDLAQVRLDADGRVCGTKAAKTTSAHELVERFMVAANEAVANWMRERGLCALYRVHPQPDAEQVQRLTDCAREFGYEPGFGASLSPGSLAAFDQQITGDASEPAIRSVLMGLVGRAHYTVQPDSHLGLGAPLYLHFTSPLRRYADFAVHRAIIGYLNGQREREVENPKVEELAKHLNERNRLASKAESQRRRMLLAEVMQEHLGEHFEAHVTRILPIGLVAQLKDSLVEGLLSFEGLPNGPWENENYAVSNGEESLTLGSPILIEITAAEPDIGRLEYRLVKRL